MNFPRRVFILIFSIFFFSFSHKIFLSQNFHFSDRWEFRCFALLYGRHAQLSHPRLLFTDTPNQIKHWFFSFFYPLLSEPPEAKHVKRLSWIEIQTQTERSWGFSFLFDLETDFPLVLERISCAFPTGTVTQLSWCWGARESYFGAQHDASLAVTCASSEKRSHALTWRSNVERSGMWTEEKRLSRWKTDRFIAICSYETEYVRHQLDDDRYL